MRRGTTPTITVSVDADITDMSTAWNVKVGTSSGSDDVAYLFGNRSGWDGQIMRFPMPDSDIYVTASA